jgi:hypothetical protein
MDASKNAHSARLSEGQTGYYNKPRRMALVNLDVFGEVLYLLPILPGLY